jgi:hypothetical protein
VCEFLYLLNLLHWASLYCILPFSFIQEYGSATQAMEILNEHFKANK